MDKEKSPWMTVKETADYLRHSVHTLETWRQQKTHPNLKFVKKGKNIRYCRDSVEKFYE